MKRLFPLGLLVFFLSNSVLSQERAEIKLPPPQKDGGKPLMQAFQLRESSRSFSSAELPPQELSNILWAAFGINRAESGKRTAPSARNWQDIEVYAFIKSGVYVYEAKKHSLREVIAEDLRGMTGTQDFVNDAPLNLLFVSDQSAMGKASHEDKNIYSGADAAFIAQNVYLYCASQGLACVVRAMVDKIQLAQRLGLGEKRKIVFAQSVGFKKK